MKNKYLGKPGFFAGWLLVTALVLQGPSAQAGAIESDSSEFDNGGLIKCVVELGKVVCKYAGIGTTTVISGGMLYWIYKEVKSDEVCDELYSLAMTEAQVKCVPFSAGCAAPVVCGNACNPAIVAIYGECGQYGPFKKWGCACP